MVYLINYIYIYLFGVAFKFTFYFSNNKVLVQPHGVLYLCMFSKLKYKIIYVNTKVYKKKNYKKTR